MTLFLESCVFRHRTALALLVALAYGWMAHANIVSTSHDPLRGSGHDSEQILVAQPGGLEHSHDNSETDDHSTEHQNGHQATDHSHDKPSVLFSYFHAVTTLSDIWSAGGPVNYDTHGDIHHEPKDFYHGYGKGRNESANAGTLQAAFDGKHGWFWRNRSGAEVTITLKTDDEYDKTDRVL